MSREVVLPVGAARIATRYDEERRGLVNDDASCVGVAPHVGAILDVEL
jgi:hypothetical protein